MGSPKAEIAAVNSCRASAESTAEILRVSTGCQSDVFVAKKMRDNPQKEKLCFSIVFSDRSLDLEAMTEGERNKWVERFEWLRKQKSKKEVGIPLHVRQDSVHSLIVLRVFQYRSIGCDNQMRGAYLQPTRWP